MQGDQGPGEASGTRREQRLEAFRRLAQNPLIGTACPEFGERMRIWLTWELRCPLHAARQRD